MDIYILTNISIKYFNLLNLNYNLLMHFFVCGYIDFSKVLLSTSARDQITVCPRVKVVK